MWSRSVGSSTLVGVSQSAANTLVAQTPSALFGARFGEKTSGKRQCGK